MREIKFKAWDKNEEQMFYGVEEGIYEDPDGMIDFDTVLGLARFEVMQFTGLTDKNGKEIYEKDVLFREGYWGYYIGFEKGSFVTVPLDDVQRISWEHKPLKDIDLSRWEIIGNKFENPELLEQHHD